MRLFLDECLSPRIAARLNAEGLHVAEHPRDFGGLGAPDHRVLGRCIERDLVLVTQNARDFRALVETEAIHPGLVILPSVGRLQAQSLLHAAMDFLAARGEPMDIMVNHVEVSADRTMHLSPLVGD
ncbi:MAG: hypothetical protein F4Y26_10575 [Gammaproteobacteria bacterium]|nr:hypothetical protein [Gammaproteobacteria bacterium]